jgi:hypothetical protein
MSPDCNGLARAREDFRGGDRSDIAMLVRQGTPLLFLQEWALA